MTAQANANANGSRESVNFVPVNIAIMFFCFVMGIASGGMALSENTHVAILPCIPCVLGFFLLLVSTLKFNTFFLRVCLRSR